jgi:uncharacterized membrane protein YbhN (UPF0104 family)
MPRLSKSLMRWIRITLAAASLIVLGIKVGHARPLERLAAANLWYVLLGVVVVIADGMTRAWNWTQLMRAMHIAPRVRYPTVLSIHWGGAFLGQIVPSTVGTDALRVLLATRKIGGLASAHWAAVAMLNLISLTAGCAAALGCSLWLQVIRPGEGMRPVALLLFSGAIAAALGGYWMLRTQRGLILRMLRAMRGPWRKLRRGLRRFMHRVLIFERQHVRLAPIVAIALATLVTRASVYALVGIAVGLLLPAPAWIALVPAYMLSGLIPYSVSGYGGDQAAIVYILTGFAASAGAALAFALIVPLMSLSYNMLGGLAVLFADLDANEQPASDAGE